MSRPRTKKAKQPAPGVTPTSPENDEKFRKNYDAKCINCDAKPTVGDTELCGPCCFGEAETANGNW
jgi:hypothetical protein